jgi:hypothetical protein
LQHLFTQFILTQQTDSEKNETSFKLPVTSRFSTIPATDCFPERKVACLDCKQSSKELPRRDIHDLSENSWIPKSRDEKGTTKDPNEPAPKVGDKVSFFGALFL